MDQKITLLAVVPAFRNNQKAQLLRINELEKKDAEVDSLKIRIAKLEDALEKEKTQTFLTMLLKDLKVLVVLLKTKKSRFLVLKRNKRM